MFGFHGNSYGHGDSKRELTNPDGTRTCSSAFTKPRDDGKFGDAQNPDEISGVLC